ncbi:hypothetical protein Tco_1112510 [Tanacetum coccineum]|uniref:Uncharacterized protein n=1 Tax=Tanacetum coccineum TaxID=301880 RepID=A0ABQ5IPK1_9ASTR
MDEYGDRLVRTKLSVSGDGFIVRKLGIRFYGRETPSSNGELNEVVYVSQLIVLIPGEYFRLQLNFLDIGLLAVHQKAVIVTAISTRAEYIALSGC